MKIAPTFTARTVFANFGPWIVYGGIAAAGFGGAAYVGGLIVSLWLIGSQWRGRRPKTMDAVSLLFFGAGAVCTLVFRSPLFLHNGSVLIWGTFAVIAWGSLLIGSPFTAEYARESVPPTFWDNPGFRRVNTAVTAVWGAVFAVNTALALLLILTLNRLPQSMKMGLLILPYVGTLTGIVFTNRFPLWASRQKPIS